MRRVLLPVSILLLLLTGACTGFFVNQPNSMTVTTGPSGTGTSTFTVASGSTVKLYATASFNSGNKDVTNSATWTSSSQCATVSAGNVRGIGNASNITVTATVAGVAGSATGSVTGGSGQTLTIASSPSGTTFTNGTQATFTASLNGTDVTASTTWSSSDTTVVAFSSNIATFGTQGTSTITASYTANGTCAAASETVTVQ